MARTARRKPHTPTAGIEPVRGDHGTGTAAANASTVLVAVPDDKNGMKRRQRIGALELVLKHSGMSQRQYQAGKRIRDTFEKTQSSPPAIKEIQVDTCPTPDATIDVQVDAQSDYSYAMSAVPPRFRHIVEHVCVENRPISQLPGSRIMGGSHRACLMVALDLVANKMGY